MSDLTQPDQDLAARFGFLVRQRRETLKLRQDDLALAAGVGRRFIIDLEAGKPTCQLGKALLVASAVGLRPLEFMRGEADDEDMLLPYEPEEAARG